MGIKLDISEDYTIGQITFDCQSIDDVRKIGDILSIIGFSMRFANIKFREKTVQTELKLSKSLNLLAEFEKSITDISSDLTGREKEESEKLERIINWRYVQEIREILHDAKRIMILRKYE
jgi:ABC-type sulfate transport system substrate-binding protein